jgi:isoleucyl-tRNA synthetase
VGSIEPLSAAGADLVDHSAKGNFRALGKRFGKQTPQVAAAIAAADAAELAASLADGGSATIDLDGSPVEIGADDVIISERPREGWSVVNDQGETVALDLELDEALRLAGLAREAIRVVQEARKSSGLDISDRISLSWSANGPMADAVRAHEALIADEVLATTITEVDGVADFTDEELGFGFALAKV